MNKSKAIAILAILGAVIGAVSNYLSTGALPDFTIFLPLVMAAYSSFHASTPAPAAPVAPPAAK